jgi:hypothetical protein
MTRATPRETGREGLDHAQRRALALRLLPQHGRGVPLLLGQRVGDRLEPAVLRVRAAGLEGHDERLAGGVHDRVRHLEAAGVDPREDLGSDGCALAWCRCLPAGQRGLRASISASLDACG